MQQGYEVYFDGYKGGKLGDGMRGRYASLLDREEEAGKDEL